MPSSAEAGAIAMEQLREEQRKHDEHGGWRWVAGVIQAEERCRQSKLGTVTIDV